jgi:hypothetical protein
VPANVPALLAQNLEKQKGRLPIMNQHSALGAAIFNFDKDSLCDVGISGD